MYEINKSAMIMIANILLRGIYPAETLVFIEEYFLKNVKHRVQIFNEWLLRQGLPTDLTIEENVRIVDSYMLSNREYYEVPRYHKTPGETIGYSYGTYLQFGWSCLTPEWESLFLDLILKIGDDYVSSSSNMYWGVQDFFPDNAMTYGGIMIFYSDTGDSKSTQKYHALLNQSYSQRVYNPDKMRPIIGDWKTLTARYNGDYKALFLGEKDYSEEIAAVIEKKKTLRERFLRNMFKGRKK